jgi:diadenosine tetraphosphate (Ap4A) HIT family hydrolase
MTDLATADRNHLMAVVFEVEAVLRDVLAPDKINLASLGNLTPHLHWHVIPRWRDDPHFPGSIWGERLREPAVRTLPDLETTLRDRLATRLAG